MLLTELLALVCPHAPPDRLAAVARALEPVLAGAEITTPARLAMLVGQLAHESGEFRYVEELASGAAYEGRRDLGNVEPGDGPRFKGRGWLQLTGRRNYREAGHALGLQLEEQPALAAQPVVAARVAAWFWSVHRLNAYADAGDLAGCTRRINGGLNGLASRDLYYRRARRALTAEEAPCGRC